MSLSYSSLPEMAPPETGTDRFTDHLWDQSTALRGAINALEFLHGLGEGTLPLQVFRTYLEQDALYLTGFAKALAILASRAPDQETAAFWANSSATAASVESSLHEGHFSTVTLGTSAYDAVYTGKADFTVSYFNVEGIEAQHADTPMRYFRYTDFGFPDAYAIVINGNQDWLRTHPEQGRKFAQALQRGYQLAADQPDKAAQDLIDANPGAFTDTKLVHEGQHLLAAQYMKDPSGKVGPQTLQQWAGDSGFLFRRGLLAGPDGKPVATEPDWSTYFTNDYLSSS